jgi:hypothetical protein
MAPGKGFEHQFTSKTKFMIARAFGEINHYVETLAAE